MFFQQKIALQALIMANLAISLPVSTMLCVSLTCSTAGAQFANTQGKTVIIPAGTSFEGRMDTTISSNHSRAGDRFNVIMSSPVLANGSDVVIPAGSQIVGEVVEAISSGHQPHEKKQKPNGKLRVQLTALRTPDGITYPLVGSFIGESSGKGQSRKANPNLGSGVAYVGSQSNFNAVYPQARQSGGNNRGPQLVTKKQMMEDPLYGDAEKGQQYGQAPTIRSIVKDHHEMYIHEGSPMSVRLDAPLKMAIAPIGGIAPSQFSDNAPQAPARPTFSRPRSSIAAPPSPAAEARQLAPQAPPEAAATAAPVVPQGPSFPSFLDPTPGQRAPVARPQFSAPPTAPQSFAPPAQQAPQAPPSFSAPQASAAPSYTPPAAGQAPGSMFSTPTGIGPAEQAAAVPSVNPFTSTSAAPPAQAAAAAQGFGSLTPAAPAGQAAAASFGSLTPPAAAGQSALPSLGSLNSAPSAAAADSLFSDAAPAKAAPPVGALGAPAAVAPAVSPVTLPPAPPAGQSLDSFINSLTHPAASAQPTAPAAPASAPVVAAPSAQTAPSLSQPAAPLAAPVAPATPTFAPPRAVPAISPPKSAPGDNF